MWEHSIATISSTQAASSQHAEIRITKCHVACAQWSRMRRFPDTILFSRKAPEGMSILSPWLAMMITVPCCGKVKG